MPTPSDQRNAADLPTQVTPTPPRTGTADLPTQVTPIPGAGGDSRATVTMADAGDLTRPTATLAPTFLRAPAADDFAGQVWGDFELGALLGRGGMGSVYRGRQVSLNRPVAVKVLPAHLGGDEGFRSRFELEARAVARLNSPHVIQVYGAGVHEGHHFFAMEFVEGSDLAKLIKTSGRIDQRQALDFVTQAARGLAAAGEFAIVHRDIKPGNMMVTPRKVLKLMDFGLVKLASEGGHHLTQTGTVMGTVSYFSPEQGRGENCDCRTDLYALGVVYYELLTGRLPFTGSDATSIIYQHIHESPRPPREIDPSIPEDVQAVVLKCLQKRADDRYPDAGVLLADLERLARGESPAISGIELTRLRQGSMLSRSTEFRRERPAAPWLALGATTAALALAGGGLWWWLAARPGPAALPATAGGATAPALAAPVPGDPAATLRELVQDRRWDEARALVRQGRAAQPDGKGWIEAARAIDQAETEDAAARCRRAIAAGDQAAAQAALERARALAPESAATLAAEDEFKRFRAAQASRAAALAEAEALLAAGRAEPAEALLQPLVQADAGDAQAAGLLARAKTARQSREQAVADARRQLAAGQAAAAGHEHEIAIAAFTAAQAVAETAQAAHDGLAAATAARAEARRQRARLDAAVAARDLTAGEGALDALRTLLPAGGEALARAEADLAQARARAAEAHRTAEEQEALRAARARDLLAALDDPRRPLADLEALAAAWLADAAGRPERALVERRLEDRRQAAAVTTLLAELDRAVAAGERAGIARRVADPAFAAGLADLARWSGLVFASRLDSFARTGERASAEVRIRHALAVYPQRDLAYRYELVRDQGVWRIAAAHLLPSP